MFRSLGVLVATFAVLAAGCSGKGDGPKITGVVMLDNQPLAEARLQFVPMADRALGVAGATTDAQGRFEIKPHPTTGATLKPGSYHVFVTKLVQKDGTPASGEDAAMLEASGVLRNLVPRKYSDPELPPQLKVEIKEGDNQLPIQLTSR